MWVMWCIPGVILRSIGRQIEVLWRSSERLVGALPAKLQLPCDLVSLLSGAKGARDGKAECKEVAGGSRALVL